MSWIKKGLIYVPDGSHSHSQTHAQVPFAYPMDQHLRIYISSRNTDGFSQPTFIEVDYDDFSRILYVHDAPVLGLGRPGENDETGVMPSWFVNMPDGTIRLYYTGWSLTRESYRLSIGLAESTDGGIHFVKKFRGPVMDRSIHNPIWAAQPSVMRMEDESWRMWYISCQKCEYINGYPEPYYRCQSATSKDGVNWAISSTPTIDFDEFNDAVGRPSVFVEDGIYKMYYSYRNALNYRTDRNQSYRLGYAESTDGENWVRKDHLVGIGKSENPNDFDYEMINYAHHFQHDGKKYLLYNGNGFGKSGFGYAVWED